MTALDLVPTWGGDSVPDAVRLGSPDSDRHTTVRLTERWARKLTDEIRHDLGSVIRKLVRAREGEAHLALGYDSWHGYCEAEFGSLRDLAIPASERVHLVASMKEARLSNRVAAEKLGVGYGTVASDVQSLRAAGWQEPATVVSQDGSVRQSRGRLKVAEPAPFQGLSRVAESAARVALQEDRGLTSIELDLETGWPMGTATGNLSKLERRGWLRRSGTFRNDRAAYVVTELGLTALEGLGQ